MRRSSSATIDCAMASSLPSVMSGCGSTKSVCPLCEALWTMPGTCERAEASTGTT
jgi:hypothetical protein